MSSSTALPIYVQIAEMLIREIGAGRLLEGERLPPEREMSKDLGISVGTLRKSLADLTEKGYLERIQGSGNYVRVPQETAGIYAFFRLELIEGGGLPRAEILSLDTRPKPVDLPAFGTDAPALRIRRRRFLGDVPAALEEIWLDGEWAGQKTDFKISDSLYLFYRARLGLWIMRAEDRIGMGQVPEWADAAFPLSSGAPCGYVERLATSREGQVAEYSRTWFDSDKVRYVSRLK